VPGGAVIEANPPLLEQRAHGSLEGLLAQAEQPADLFGAGAIADSRWLGLQEPLEHSLRVTGHLVEGMSAQG
jgi:hypothetical protein